MAAAAAAKSATTNASDQGEQQLEISPLTPLELPFHPSAVPQYPPLNPPLRVVQH